jgi:hypothetical protein
VYDGFGADPSGDTSMEGAGGAGSINRTDRKQSVYNGFDIAEQEDC